MRTRWMLLAVLGLALACAAIEGSVGSLAGSRRDPTRLAPEASAEARALLERTFADLDPEDQVDHHAHVIGLGTGGSGCEADPDLLTWWHPVKHVRFLVFSRASGIDDLERADQEFAERLFALARGADLGRGFGRRQLLGFDRFHTADGEPDPERSELYVPNDWVLELCAEDPEHFLAAGSVHPYRADALSELDRLAARGVRWIKWLPSAMGIDPSDPACDPFYERMAEHDMVLLSHAGKELAVEADLQRLGNPLLLRRALERGVKVVVAHCASLGRDQDLDRADRRGVPSFDLFLRMMDDPRYEGLLFGEISAVTQWNRMHVIETLLERTDLHHRLVDGSDYPLPAVGFLVSTRALANAGLLTWKEREALNEIREFNPLLFDLALKRALKHPVTGVRFPASVFRAHPELDGDAQ